ncbi:Biopolymer transport protein ExbD/TolR [Rosistilla ulvae]|uniref:Biopolymer transport protein ExbD/TolR n=1 Tax=Rosistilla ulvae TaxID=1930277 RepID=A0A517LVY3_9BACT|nr:biopolymer transporter ExbD [Rosistilla ulvae]QDS86759.1 Biopolymer transport protein ExbD/TolR [Rosistilla ulvae]
MKIRNRSEGIKNELQMTSMIDIVFLLLVFFIMTFKIVEQEGDFNIKMPLASQNQQSQSDDMNIPLKVRMESDASGGLLRMRLNEIDLGTDFSALRKTVVGLVGAGGGPTEGEDGQEVEIDADYNLRYEYTIEAITMVTGEKRGKETVKLIDKIKFAPTRRPN